MHCAPLLTWNAELATLSTNWLNNLVATQQANVIPMRHPTTQQERSTYLTMVDSNGNPCCTSACTQGDQANCGIVGQNIAYGPLSAVTSTDVFNKQIEDVVADWYEEVALPNVSDSQGNAVSQPVMFTGQDITFTSLADRQTAVQAVINSMRTAGTIPSTCADTLAYQYGAPIACNPETGHFTQVVWKGSTQVGCAQVPLNQTMTPGYDLWVCNYAKLQEMFKVLLIRTLLQVTQRMS